jgi:tetratricopeptide (TPR) repeat protein
VSPFLRTVMLQLTHQGAVRQEDEIHVPRLALATPELTIAHAQVLFPVPMEGLRSCPALPIGLENAMHFPIRPVGNQNLGRFGIALPSPEHYDPHGMVDAGNADTLGKIPLHLAVHGRFAPAEWPQLCLHPVTCFPVFPIDRDGAIELQVADVIPAMAVDVVEDLGIGEVAVEGEIARNGLLAIFNTLGNLASSGHDYVAAAQYFQDSLAVARAAGDKVWIGTFLHNLGYTAYQTGDYTAADRYASEALAINRAIGDRAGVVDNLILVGAVASAQGNSAAERHYKAALRAGMAIGALPSVLEALSRLAALWAKAGAHVRAAQLLGLVLNHPASDEEVKEVARPLLDELHTLLKPNELEAALERGKSLDLDAVVARIVGQR